MNNIILNAFIDNKWVDISEFIGDTVTRVNNYDVTFDTANISLILKDGAIEGINSRDKLLNGMPFFIKYQNETEIYFYRLDDDEVEHIGLGRKRIYKHNLRLIEPGNELKYTKIPNMSFTQPAGDISIYGKDRRVLKQEFTINISDPNYGSDTQKVTAQPWDIVKDNDNNDGSILRSGKNYHLILEADFINEGFYHPYPSGMSFIKSIFDWEYAVTNLTLALNTQWIPPKDIIWLQILTEKYPSTGSMTEIYKTKNINLPYGDVDKIQHLYHVARENNDMHDWYIGELRPGKLNNKYYLAYTPEQDITINVNTWWINTLFAFFSSAGALQPTIIADYKNVHVSLTLSILEIDDVNVVTGNKITLERAVNKVLNNINFSKTLGQNNVYELDENTRGRIKNEVVSDSQLVGYNAWDALVKLASEVDAIPYLTGDHLTTVKFLFRTDQKEADISSSLVLTEAKSINKDDYVKGYSLDTSNIVPNLEISSYKKDPPGNIYYSVRTSENDIDQITEDNAVFIFREPIYDKHKFLLKGGTNGGIKIVVLDNGVEKTINDNTGKGYWDITSRVIEEKQYRALDDHIIQNNNDRHGLQYLKGNTLYYAKEDRIIKGLGHRPKSKPGFIYDEPQEYPALIEMIIHLAFKKLVDDGSDINLITFSRLENYNITKDIYDNIEIKAIYPTISNTNINLYKYDANKKLIDRITPTSASEHQTSLSRLSTYMTSVLNEKGNIDYIIDGISKPYVIIPEVGDILELNDKKYTINTQEITYGKRFNRFTITLAENLVNQNTNIGINDERRSFEIADTNIVDRIDKFRTFIQLISTVDDTNIGRNDNKDYFRYRYGNISNVYNNMSILSLNSIPNLITSVGYLYDTDKDRSISSVYLNVKPSEIEEEKNIIYPIDSYYMNTTMIFEAGFIDNYSAGSIVDNISVEGARFKGNRPLNYTNDLGNIWEIGSRFLSGNLSEYSYNPDRVPETETIWTNSKNTILNFDYRPDKDNREKLKIQAEITYMAHDHELTTIYPALAKYSPLLDKSISNGEDESIHDIAYAFCYNDININLNKTTLDITKIYKTDEELPINQKIELIYGKYDNSNNLQTSFSDTDAEFTGIRIPYISEAPILVIYNRKTLEVLLYHKLKPGINITSNKSDLWFIPYRDTFNYMDELTLGSVEGIDINIDVRLAPEDDDPENSVIFNVVKHESIRNILTYPSIYTTNISSFYIPTGSTLVDRNTRQVINWDSIIYEDREIDIVYKSKTKLLPPLIVSVNKDICDQISIRVKNQNNTPVKVFIDFKNGEGYKEYSFSANQEKTLEEVYGFNKGSLYYIELYSAISEETDPIYGYNSDTIEDIIEMPMSCTIRTLIWTYDGPVSGPCIDPGLPVIGTTCSIENDTREIAGVNDGYVGCIRIKCTRK